MFSVVLAALRRQNSGSVGGQASAQTKGEVGKQRATHLDWGLAFERKLKALVQEARWLSDAGWRMGKAIPGGCVSATSCRSFLPERTFAAR